MTDKPGRRHKPILIVEDELFAGLDVAEELEAKGYVVYGPISNMRSAEQVVSLYQFGAAILDYQLQDGTSYDLALQLLDKDIPVLFYTGNAAELRSDPIADRTMIIDKPASTDEIVAAIERAVISVV